MLFSNIKLATMTEGRPYGLIEDGAVIVDDGHITWAGARQDAPRDTGRKTVDCGGRLLTPGLIDCHTHLVYGGNRANEFERRLNGATYADIAKAGGGILSTVRATREASEDDLVRSASVRLASLLSEGVTTVEIKSGYGLDVDTEIKMLTVARKLGESHFVDVVTSYLGAHTFPAEYRDDHATYVDIICSKALPSIARARLADAVDAFCEGIAFSVAETEKVFATAKKLGLPVKLHAEQLSNLGGAKLAARYDALSVDHIEYLDDDGVAAIARSNTIAVLLPGAFYYLKEKHHPPVAALRRHEVPIAIATDLNPGSSPVHSLLATMNMACVLFGLTPEEALRGVTANAARALGFKDRGMIARGLKADLVLWNAERPGDLAYPLGFNPCAAVIRNGAIVRGTI